MVKDHRTGSSTTSGGPAFRRRDLANSHVCLPWNKSCSWMCIFLLLRTFGSFLLRDKGIQKYFIGSYTGSRYDRVALPSVVWVGLGLLGHAKKTALLPSQRAVCILLPWLLQVFLALFPFQNKKGIIMRLFWKITHFLAFSAYTVCGEAD